MDKSDKPRVSRSYSTLEQTGNDTLESIKNRSLISVSAETYKLYSEYKRKIGISDDTRVISYLIDKVSGIKETAGLEIPEHAGLEVTEHADGGAAEINRTPDAAAADVTTSHPENKLSSAQTKIARVHSGGPSSRRDRETLPTAGGGIASHYSLPDVSERNADVQLNLNREPKVDNSLKAGDSAKGKRMELTTSGYSTSGSAREGSIAAGEQFICKRCKVAMSSPEELEDHMETCDILSKYKRRDQERMAITQYNYCRFCGMRYSSQLEYKKHYNQYHVNHSDFYTCSYCNRKQAFTEKKGLREHQKSDPICQACHRSFNKLQHLQLHLQNKNHDKKKKKERSVKSAGPTKQHVPPVVEAMEKSEQPELPHGFSFMSVKVNRMYRLPEPESERSLYVPETSYREGYILQPEFTATPFPELPIEEVEEDYSEQEDYTI